MNDKVVQIESVDHVYIRVKIPDQKMKLSFFEHFQDYRENYFNDPRFRVGTWNGKEEFYDLESGLIYRGLLRQIALFFKKKNIKFVYDLALKNEPDINEIEKFFERTKDLYSKTLRDYQKIAVIEAVGRKRRCIECPTSSGKTFVIFNVMEYFRFFDKRILIIVPRKSLVVQTVDEFKSYYKTVPREQIGSSLNKKTMNSPCVVSTWQTLNAYLKNSPEYFKKFDVVIVDEAHKCDGAVLSSILKECSNAHVRLGFSGSYFKTKANLMTLNGLMGDIYKTVTTKQLMDLGVVARLKIKTLILNYSQEDRNFVRRLNYQDELSFIESHTGRMRFVVDFLKTRKSNTLFLFKHIEHGKQVFSELKKQKPEHVFVLYGQDSVETRQEVINTVEKNDDCVVIASYGIFSEGINILNLQNVVLGVPIKSPTVVIQSIGRGLRRCAEEEKNDVVFYDLIDDLSRFHRNNYAMKHGLERAELYKANEFENEIKEWKIKNGDS